MPKHNARSQTQSPRRRDIEALRAISILAVVGFHAAPELVRGGFVGVDIFFVLSGFLITGLILTEIDQTGQLGLARFWARRARRLLPATATVLVFCAFLTLTVLPVSNRRIFGSDITAAAFYAINWRLAARSVDYLAEGVSQSPVQHFWSLAVEEQFYILWPLLITAVLWVAIRSRSKPKHLLLIVITMVSVASLTHSVLLTQSQQSLAYFLTTTRIWELGLGAIGAFAAARVARLNSIWRHGLGLAGLAGLAAAIFGFSAATIWPSYRAVLPCAAGLAVVLAGTGGGAANRLDADPSWLGSRLLAWRPLVWLGGLSYSWYLWHWPIIIAVKALAGEQTWLTPLAALASLIPAWAMSRLIENPIRFAPRLVRSATKSLVVGALCTALAAGVGLGVAKWNQWFRSGPGTMPNTAATINSTLLTGGAAVVAADGDNWLQILDLRSYPTISPDPVDAIEDKPTSYDNGCRPEYGDSSPMVCPTGDSEGRFVVAAVGDSMIQQWEPALDLIGQRNHFRVDGYYKSGCVWTTAMLPRPSESEPYRACQTWGRNVLERLKATRPDLVVVSQGSVDALSDPENNDSPAGPEPMAAGELKYWRELTESGIPLVVIRTNPSFLETDQTTYECVEQHRDDLRICAQVADRTISDFQDRLVKAAAPANIPIIDLNPLICAQDTCPAVVGGVLVYRQTTHLTVTFVKTLAPAMEEQLLAAIKTLGLSVP